MILRQAQGFGILINKTHGGVYYEQSISSIFQRKQCDSAGSSGFGKAVEGLKVSVDPSCTITEGAILNGGISEDVVKGWIA